MIQEILSEELSKKVAADRLGVEVRSINRYLCHFREAGPQGLYDHRGSNHQKIDEKAERQIVQAKLQGRHRSARLIRDRLGLGVHEETIRQVLIKHHLERSSLPPVKPIKRFEAAEPNDLWQIDIQGKVSFPLIGELLLILVKDDHSRFILAGRWFFHQYKINVFMVLHEAFVRWGLPKAILSDRGSQFKASQLHGQAEYQYLMRRLGIEPLYGKKPRTKGKIENQFRFVQRDFVLENLDHSQLDSLSGAWEKWMHWYNWKHRHRGLNGDSPADHYVRSLRRPSVEELELLLIHEEPRKVTRTGHISYYGQFYRVPDKYIGRRVWTVLKGETLRIDCGSEVIGRYRVKTDYLKALPRDS
ncbi:MAG: DDE-type integrase/transposase/recombinase [Candidatus Binatia bacterium]